MEGQLLLDRPVEHARLRVRSVADLGDVDGVDSVAEEVRDLRLLRAGQQNPRGRIRLIHGVELYSQGSPRLDKLGNGHA